MKPNEYWNGATLSPQARRGRRFSRYHSKLRGRFFSFGSWKSLLVAFIVVGLAALFRGLRGERDE
ncbi:MAG: hypothetical protein J6K20_12350 [Thermoguttaceae bacterium]|nr:hypothetical protein [Thermoguttaceae bacterium]MBQ7030053.1 hypothetical protein [Thermoguttaceae bacterium]